MPTHCDALETYPKTVSAKRQNNRYISAQGALIPGHIVFTPTMGI